MRADFHNESSGKFHELIASNLTDSLTSTYTITSSDTGTHYVINSATTVLVYLPPEQVGLEFWFHIGATEPGSGETHGVWTHGLQNTIVGNITSTEDGAGSVAITVDADKINFIAAKALHGDFAHVWSDGTNWYLDGQCTVQDGITVTQAGG